MVTSSLTGLSGFCDFSPRASTFCVCELSAFWNFGARCSSICRRLHRLHICNFHFGWGPLQFNLPSPLLIWVYLQFFHVLRLGPAAVKSAVAVNVVVVYLHSVGPAAVESAVAFTSIFGCPSTETTWVS